MTRNYRTLYHKGEVEICGIMNGTETNMIWNWFIDVIKDTLVPGTIHSCPYIVSIVSLNGRNDQTMVFKKTFFSTQNCHFLGRVQNVRHQVRFKQGPAITA
jgi:hypothetical protein